jgi:hypothetical protein
LFSFTVVGRVLYICVVEKNRLDHVKGFVKSGDGNPRGTVGEVLQQADNRFLSAICHRNVN